MRQRTLLIAVAVLRPDEAGAEHREQIRAWARFGLAARLDVDTGGTRDAFLDAFPLRDNGFGDLARQPAGPGRALYHDDVVHLPVPRDDARGCGD
jgi:hypothetical protein